MQLNIVVSPWNNWTDFWEFQTKLSYRLSDENEENKWKVEVKDKK